MSFDPSTAQHLKPWLVRHLEPICDAEPTALADYILALLKNPRTEADARVQLTNDLEEFLEKECGPFVDNLFKALRSKSYLPYAEDAGTSVKAKADAGIPIPVDNAPRPAASDRSRKRNLEDDDFDQRPSAKGPRLSSEGNFSRYGGRGGSTGNWNGPPRIAPDFAGHQNGRGYQPPHLPRGMCRDYHNHGFCMRGSTCKYSHGQDVIPLSDAFMFPMGPQGMPFMPMFDQAAAFSMEGGGYDPNQSNMDMSRHGQGQPPRPRNVAPSVLPRGPAENGPRAIRGSNVSGELPVIQDLTPSSSERPNRPHPHIHVDSASPHANGHQDFPMNGKTAIQSFGSQGLVPMDIDGAPHQRLHPPQRGGFRGRGGRPKDAPGTFSAEASNLRPEKRKGLTLVVEKIPREKLNLEHVNEWFKRFGTVTNVAIDAASSKALVSFATNEEAHAAWKCEDAVFGNRFVKVFWHRPMEGHGQKGVQLLAASAKTVAGLTAKEPSPDEPPRTTTPAAKAAPASTHTALAAKQRLLEKQIAEQKSLMNSLDTASQEEKKEIMARLRKLGEEMKGPVPSSSTPAPVQADREQQLRERLDKELELVTARSEEIVVDDTDALKEQLEKLKAEAASLGLPAGGAEPSYPPSRGFRGRGRGRGAQNRGFVRATGYPRGNYKLDNRPKKLLVKGIPPETQELQPLRDWYEAIGPIDSFDRLDDGNVVVSFKTRDTAEQGFAKGTGIPQLGTVQLSWYTGAVPASAPAPQVSTAADPDTEMVLESSEHHEPDEEELVSGEWGDGEDGTGML